MGVKILLMLVLIVVNGLFSMTEMAVVSLRKSKLQSEIARGNRKAQTAQELSEHPSDFFFDDPDCDYARGRDLRSNRLDRLFGSDRSAAS